MYRNIRIIGTGFLLFILSFSLHAKVEVLETLLKEQRFQEAYQFGNQLLAEEAGNPNFDMAFGIAAQRSGAYDHALFAFERVLMHNSNTQVARFELARTHFMLGDLIVARRHFNQLIEADPQPPAAAMKRIQWYMAAINAKEAGKAVAASDGVTRFYLGARLGYDSNPSNTTSYSSITLDRNNQLLDFTTPKVNSDSLHELQAGITHYQQQGENWGWFAGANTNLKGYHDSKNKMSNYSLGLQGGGVLLGKDWRLSLPTQINKQIRDDDNEVLVLAFAADFNKRLTSEWDYTAFGQLAIIDYKLSSSASASRDAKSFTTGLSFSYRANEKLRFNAGPLVGIENADTKVYSRNIHGIRSSASYLLSDKQRFDFNLDYLNTQHRGGDINFGNKKRNDDQLSAGIKFSYRYKKDWLFDLGLEQSVHSSNIDLYTYRRTQLNAGVRKEW